MYCRVPESRVISWIEGLKRQLHSKGPGKLRQGVAEAWALAGAGPSAAPPGWWTELGLSTAVGGVDANDDEDEDQGPASPSPTEGGHDGGVISGADGAPKRPRPRPPAARDILRILANRLRVLVPALAADAPPSTTEELAMFIKARTGIALPLPLVSVCHVGHLALSRCLPICSTATSCLCHLLSLPPE
jgi:hypothetical protein